MNCSPCCATPATINPVARRLPGSGRTGPGTRPVVRCSRAAP